MHGVVRPDQRLRAHLPAALQHELVVVLHDLALCHEAAAGGRRVQAGALQVSQRSQPLVRVEVLAEDDPRPLAAAQPASEGTRP